MLTAGTCSSHSWTCNAGSSRTKCLCAHAGLPACPTRPTLNAAARYAQASRAADPISPAASAWAVGTQGPDAPHLTGHRTVRALDLDGDGDLGALPRVELGHDVLGRPAER